MSDTVTDFSARTIDGAERALSDYRGKVLLIVNTASRCGFTPQFEGLERLYEDYRERGLEVLGFPCNQFAHQEPEGEEQIRSFCTTRYNVKFPLFAKIEVNGKGAHPLYVWLKGKAGSFLTRDVKWNFTKFLVARDGTTVKRFSPTTEPETLRKDIEALL